MNIPLILLLPTVFGKCSLDCFIGPFILSIGLGMVCRGNAVFDPQGIKKTVTDLHTWSCKTNYLERYSMIQLQIFCVTHNSVFYTHSCTSLTKINLNSRTWSVIMRSTSPKWRSIFPVFLATSVAVFVYKGFATTLLVKRSVAVSTYLQHNAQIVMNKLHLWLSLKISF